LINAALPGDFLDPGLEELKRPFGACGFQKLLDCAKDFVGYGFVVHMGAPMDWWVYLFIAFYVLLRVAPFFDRVD
jgi:hypothetical protein